MHGETMKNMKMFHVLFLASSWGKTDCLIILCLLYTCQNAFSPYLHIAFDQSIYSESSISKYNF